MITYRILVDKNSKYVFVQKLLLPIFIIDTFSAENIYYGEWYKKKKYFVYYSNCSFTIERINDLLFKLKQIMSK